MGAHTHTHVKNSLSHTSHLKLQQENSPLNNWNVSVSHERKHGSLTIHSLNNGLTCSAMLSDTAARTGKSGFDALFFTSWYDLHLGSGKSPQGTYVCTCGQMCSVADWIQRCWHNFNIKVSQNLVLSPLEGSTFSEKPVKATQCGVILPVACFVTTPEKKIWILYNHLTYSTIMTAPLVSLGHFLL